MKIPEFPELTHGQADTIIVIMIAVAFLILTPITIISQHLADHQFYISHKQECLSNNGIWKEERNKNRDFSWSCNYRGLK